MSGRRDSDEGQDKMEDNLYSKDNQHDQGNNNRFTQVVDSKYEDNHQEKENRLLATIKFDFKVVLVGDASVGKTCIFSRFINNNYTGVTESSMSLLSGEKKLNLDQSTVANLQVWDTCGEEKFRHIGRAFFKNIHGAIIVFDVTERKTFEALQYWIDDVKENAPEDALMIIVGNKADDSSKRQVTSKEGNAYASSKGLEYYDVSAKTGNNVALSFEMLTNKIQTKFEDGGFKNMGKKGGSLKADINKAIQDTNPSKPVPAKKGCC